MAKFGTYLQNPDVKVLTGLIGDESKEKSFTALQAMFQDGRLETEGITTVYTTDKISAVSRFMERVINVGGEVWSKDKDIYRGKQFYVITAYIPDKDGSQMLKKKTAKNPESKPVKNAVWDFEKQALSKMSIQELEREYNENRKHTFGRLFGGNARTYNNLIVDELHKRGVQDIPEYNLGGKMIGMEDLKKF